MPTISVENYLKAIYNLQSTSERVSTKQLAGALAVSQPSVTSMLQAMSGEGLIYYQAYKGALLSPVGERMALQVIRKHRLIEMFLMETLGYSWDEVHDEAEALEHAISDLLAERMDAFLGHPQFDPHGDPIPTAEGHVHHRDLIPLHEVVPGMCVRVARVLDQAPDVLRYLTSVGLVPDSNVEVVGVLPFDGQMKIRVSDSELQVSRTLASRLLVAEVLTEKPETGLSGDF